MNIRITLLLLISLVFYNCTGPRYATNSTGSTPRIDPPLITRSLFDSPDRTISEEDIQRLLEGKINVPDTVRVAVFKHGSTSINRYYVNWWTDEEYLKTQQELVDALTTAVTKSGRVKKIIPVPALMTSQSPNITQLRETAVRLQADLLIVYSLTSDIYYKYKVFQKNEAKAFATCETIVMDIRTGVIPHSSVITREKLVVKDQQDLNDSETRKKAEREAAILALTESGTGVAGFLGSR